MFDIDGEGLNSSFSIDGPSLGFIGLILKLITVGLDELIGISDISKFSPWFGPSLLEFLLYSWFLIDSFSENTPYYFLTFVEPYLF